MKKNLLSIIVQVVIFLVIITSFVYCYQEMNYKAMMIILLILLLLLFLFSFKRYPFNIPFILFLVTLFTFLFGRMTVTEIFDYNSNLVGILGTAFSDPQIVIVILNLLFVSLISLFIGFFVKIPMKQNMDMEINNKEIKMVSKYIFCFSFILRIFILIEMIQRTSTLGYYETFASFRSSLPESIVFISEMYDISLFVFLGCMPEKREALPFMSLYLFEGILSLWSGRRADILLNIIVLILYIFYREYFSNTKERWIRKKQILIGICFIPVFFIVLNVIGNIRRGDSLSTNRVSESMYDFFFAQGISVNVLGYTINFKDSLPKKIYSLGPIIEFFKVRFLIKLTGAENFYFGQNVSRAIEGNIFSHTISYYIMPDLYLRGIGYGSSYIAELYKDFAYIGLILGNIFYGFLLGNLYRLLIRLNPYFKGSVLLMVRQIMFAPRSSFTNFLVASFSLPKIACLILILSISYVLKQNGSVRNIKV